MSDAVELARDCVERWDDITAPTADVAVTLARAVIEQDEQLATLRAALREALDADADDCHSLGDKRRAELRRLL